MIIDWLANAGFYTGLEPGVVKGLRYLKETDLRTLTPGRYPIEGEEVFALVMEYQTKDVAQAKWEAHRRYHDIQYLAAGQELMGYADLTDMAVEEYREEKDFVALKGGGVFMPFKEGMFAFFSPQDGHAPGLALKAPAPVRKVVVKVRVKK